MADQDLAFQVCSMHGKPKNHSISQHGIVIAEVLGGGYEGGWAPHTEEYAHQIVRALNIVHLLTAAAKPFADCIENDLATIGGGTSFSIQTTAREINKLKQASTLAGAND